MSGLRACVSLFALSGVGLVAGGALALALPSTCGAVGRPNLETAAIVTLAAGALVWFIGAVVWFAIAANLPRPNRFALAGVGLLELGAGLAILIYIHQAVGYNCG